MGFSPRLLATAHQVFGWPKSTRLLRSRLKWTAFKNRSQQSRSLCSRFSVQTIVFSEVKHTLPICSAGQSRLFVVSSVACHNSIFNYLLSWQRNTRSHQNNSTIESTHLSNHISRLYSPLVLKSRGVRFQWSVGGKIPSYREWCVSICGLPRSSVVYVVGQLTVTRNT